MTTTAPSGPVAELPMAGDWRFLPCAAKSLDTRKVTRRRAELQLKLGHYFPPEGHSIVEVSRKEVNGVTLIDLAVTGGARHREEATWKFGRFIYILQLAVEEEDVVLSSVKNIHVSGADISPLSSATLVSKDGSLYLFGGFSTSSMQITNEMFVSAEKAKKGCL